MTQFGFPYLVNRSGHTGGAGYEDHVKDMIEMVLFTAPGERVNRPEFGTGLRQMLFTENAPELAEATQHLVQSGLQRWLSEAIAVRSVDVGTRESSLYVTVVFRVLDETEERTVQLQKEV